MAKLPTVQDMGGRYIPSPGTGVRGLRGGEAVGRAVEQLGKVGQQVGLEALDREATALAKERDTFVADQVRDLMYNPETGFANQKGRNAIDSAAATDEALEKIGAEASRGLSQAATEKVTAQIARRMEGARNTIAQHTSRERDTWAAGASEARIYSAIQDAIVDPSLTQDSINTIRGEEYAAAARDGLSNETRDINIQKRVTQLYVEQIQDLSTTDPELAYKYFEDNADKMTPSEVNDLRPGLKKDAAIAGGRREGASAYEAYKAGGSASSPEAYRVAIAAVESRGSGDYNARGDVIENPDSMYYGERALGRYQIMPGNLSDWSKAALGREVSEEEFMASPELQDKIFDHRFGVLVSRYGNARDAASAWFTGGPLSVGGDKSDGNIKGREYVRRFDEALGGLGSGIGGKTANEIEMELRNIEDPDRMAAAVREFSARAGLDRQNSTQNRNDTAQKAMAAVWDQGLAPEDMEPELQRALKDLGMWDLAGSEYLAKSTGVQQRNDYKWMSENYSNLSPEERLQVPIEELKQHMNYTSWSAEVKARQEGMTTAPLQGTTSLIKSQLAEFEIDINGDDEDNRQAVREFYEAYDAAVVEFQKQNNRAPANAFEEQAIIKDVTAKWDLLYVNKAFWFDKIGSGPMFKVTKKENLLQMAGRVGATGPEVRDATALMDAMNLPMNEATLRQVLRADPEWSPDGVDYVEPPEGAIPPIAAVTGAADMMRGG